MSRIGRAAVGALAVLGVAYVAMLVISFARCSSYRVATAAWLQPRAWYVQTMMKFRSVLVVAHLAVTLSVLGCADRKAQPAASPPARSSATTPEAATDRWRGQWTGPEGTFLRLAGGPGRYDVTIQDLDGPRTFQGNGVGDAVHFERDGRKESIRATTGAATGMKWLSEKTNCLTVRVGEGYCRD